MIFTVNFILDIGKYRIGRNDRRIENPFSPKLLILMTSMNLTG